MSFPLEEFIKKANQENKSKEYIEATTAYIKKLTESNYPVIFSLENLAILMGVQSSYLRFLIGEGEEYNNYQYKYKRYKYFKLKKKTGGFREIMVPEKQLKYIQKWILKYILNNYKLSDSCTGFRKGKSILDNAKPHENADVILKVDLLKFYDTIDIIKVSKAFKEMGYIKNLAISLAKLTTAKHKIGYWAKIPSLDLSLMGYNANLIPSVLPQGAPSSPALANIVASKMDRKFELICNGMGCNYSRYADDLTFSIKGGGVLPDINVIRRIIKEEGFVVNNKKIKYLKRGKSQYVTGLTTTNGVNVSKKTRKNITRHIFFCRKFGVENHLRKIEWNNSKESKMIYHDWLLGSISFIYSINNKAGKRLFEDFNKIDWFI